MHRESDRFQLLGQPQVFAGEINYVQSLSNNGCNYSYAAATAWVSKCMEICGADSIGGLNHEEWLTEAINSYQWALDHGTANDAQMIAAATLYRATDSLEYQTDFETTKNASSRWYNNSNWSSIPDWHFAAWNYLKISSENHTGLNITLQEDCLADIRARADIEVVGPAADRGYRWELEKRNNWMLGTFSTPHISAAAITRELTGVEYYKTACHTTCDYHLGGNEMNLVWLCMIGDEDFSRSTAFPTISNFPDAEARFQNTN